MGLDIILQTESGEELEALADPRNLLKRLLPDARDSSFRCIKYVDAYGDTVFNVLQMDDLIHDLDQLQPLADPAQSELLEGVRRLAMRVREENAHLYLKFEGD